MSRTSMLVTYALELVVAVVLVAIDLKVFLVYAFMALTFGFDRKADYLRKMIRVYQVVNGVKLHAILSKLEIAPTELEKITKEMEGELTEEQLASLEKDLRDLQQ